MVWHHSFINIFFGGVKLSTIFFFFLSKCIELFHPWLSMKQYSYHWDKGQNSNKKSLGNCKMTENTSILRKDGNLSEHTQFSLFTYLSCCFLYLCLKMLVCVCFIKLQYKERWGMKFKSYLQNSLLLCIYVGISTLLWSITVYHVKCNGNETK